MKLSLPVVSNSTRAKNAVDCTSPVWDKLSPDSKRAVNAGIEYAKKENPDA